MHIININTIGGAEKLIPVLLQHLNGPAIQTGCLIFHKEGGGAAAESIKDKLISAGVKVNLFSYKKIWDKSIFSTIVKITTQDKYDLIHSHLKHADMWLSYLKSRKKICIPVVSTLHGYRDSYQNKYALNYKKQILFTPYYWLTRFTCSQLDGYILISECLKQFYQLSGLLKKKPATVIYHGYPHTAEITGSRSSTHNNQPRIVLPGRLIKMKGHSYAIEAIGMLNDIYPGISLHIYGKGPEEETLMTLVKESGMGQQILFHGYTDDLMARLKESEVVVLPSMGESFGMVFLEAFAAGVPVVAFDLPAGNEIVKNQYTGLLAIPYSSESLAENIGRLLSDHELSNRLVSQAHKELQSRFSMQKMVDNYLSFYMKVLRREN